MATGWLYRSRLQTIPGEDDFRPEDREVEVTDPGLFHECLLRQLYQGLGLRELAARASELDELIREKTSDIVW